MTLSHTIDIIHEFGRDRLKMTTDSMRKNHDRNIQLNPFTEGDLVWLYNPSYKGKGAKLQCHWEGPYRVEQKISDVIYRVKKTRRSKTKIVHHNHLKAYSGTNTWGD